MNIFPCISIWIHTHAYTFEYIPTHIHLNTYPVFEYIPTDIHLNTYSLMHIWIHTHSYTFEHKPTHKHLNTYPLIKMWTHFHACAIEYTSTLIHLNAYTLLYTPPHVYLKTRRHVAQGALSKPNASVRISLVNFAEPSMPFYVHTCMHVRICVHSFNWMHIHFWCTFTFIFRSRYIWFTFLFYCKNSDFDSIHLMACMWVCTNLNASYLQQCVAVYCSVL